MSLASTQTLVKCESIESTEQLNNWLAAFAEQHALSLQSLFAAHPCKQKAPSSLLLVYLVERAVDLEVFWSKLVDHCLEWFPISKRASSHSLPRDVIVIWGVLATVCERNGFASIKSLDSHVPVWLLTAVRQTLDESPYGDIAWRAAQMIADEPKDARSRCSLQ